MTNIEKLYQYAQEAAPGHEVELLTFILELAGRLKGDGTHEPNKEKCAGTAATIHSA